MLRSLVVSELASEADLGKFLRPTQMAHGRRSIPNIGAASAVSRVGPTTPTRGVQPRAMTQATFRVIVAETPTAIDADRVSRRMTHRPTSRRQNRWKKAWTELSKEAVWLAIVEGCVLLQDRVERSQVGMQSLVQ